MQGNLDFTVSEQWAGGLFTIFYRFHFHGKIKKNILVFLWRKEIKEYTILLIYFFAKSQITDENNY